MKIKQFALMTAAIFLIAFVGQIFAQSSSYYFQYTKVKSAGYKQSEVTRDQEFVTVIGPNMTDSSNVVGPFTISTPATQFSDSVFFNYYQLSTTSVATDTSQYKVVLKGGFSSGPKTILGYLAGGASTWLKSKNGGTNGGYTGTIKVGPPFFPFYWLEVDKATAGATAATFRSEIYPVVKK